jgi:tripartite-type tricarboxylate transporter receptor subunit TctC
MSNREQSGQHSQPIQSPIAAFSCAVVLGLGAAGAAAQDYPNRVVRMVVPWPAGGAADLLGRTVAQKLSERLGHQVVVDNKPGASGNIGTEMAARATPNGYTIATGSVGNLSINPTLYDKLPYDAKKDFAPISMGVAFPNLLVVHPSVPAKSVKEFVVLAKSKNGNLTYASTGIGSPLHLAGELFASMAGVQMVHVPYKGASPAVSDLLGGQVSAMFSPVFITISQIGAGKLRALGVTSASRLPTLPDIPTIAESGFPGYEAIAWNGFIAPAGTPKPIITRLNTEIVAILKMPDVKERLGADGSIVMGSSPEEFAAFIDAETLKWGRVIKASGARAE